MTQPSRIRSNIIRRLCSVVLCGLVAASSMHAAEAGEAHVRRLNGFRNGQFEAHNARMADRMQQRQQQRAAQREANVQRAPEPVQQPAPPAYQAPEPAQERGRPGRMTLDERRALRQQINEAGRDVYRPNRP